MKQCGIWKAVMSIYKNINDFLFASGKDRKWTIARALYSKQRPVFVNFFTTWSNINTTTFHYMVKIATHGVWIL